MTHRKQRRPRKIHRFESWAHYVYLVLVGLEAPHWYRWAACLLVILGLVSHFHWPLEGDSNDKRQ